MSTPKKPSAKPGLLPKLKRFIDALGDRYQRVLQVIDEALASESLKDKIWAVDLILKRTPTTTPDKKEAAFPAAEEALSPDISALSQLSETELLERVRRSLKDWEP